MKKISDFFGVEAFYDPVKRQFHFYWDEGDESYIYDLSQRSLIDGDKNNFTWEIIKDWYEDNKERINEMLKSDEPYYVEDIIKP